MTIGKVIASAIVSILIQQGIETLKKRAKGQAPETVTSSGKWKNMTW